MSKYILFLFILGVSSGLVAQFDQEKKDQHWKRIFHQIYNGFKDLKSSESLELLRNILSDIENSYKELENGHAEYIELLNRENEQDLIDMNNIVKGMDTIYNELCNLRAHVTLL